MSMPFSSPEDGVAPPGLAHDLASSAQRHATRPALLGDTEVLDYAGLTTRAAGVAEQLVTASVPAGSVVGLISANVSDGVTAAFGVLGAGCTLCVIDCVQPPERSARMLALAGAAAVLAGPGGEVLARDVAARLAVACIEPGAGAGAGERRAAYPLRAAPPGTPALVNFTSGSTGAPRGCLESEADTAVRHRLHAELMGLEPGRVLGLAHHFGNNRNQLHAALMSGAAVALYDFGRDGLVGLPDWLESQRVDTLRLSPSTARQLVAWLLPRRRLSGLRCVMLTGERIHGADLHRLRELCPRATLLTVYSSSETGPSIALRVAPGETIPAGHLPLGQALPGKRVLVVGDDGRALGPGRRGELVVESSALFAGYCAGEAGDKLVRDEQTGQLRVRTGDLASQDEQGLFYHHGRLDGMIKLRGHRIEPGEVEAALLDCPGVLDAAVVGWRRADGQAALLAYLVPVRGQELDAQALRAALARVLPAYMVPAHFEVLDDPPLGASGKLDRAALPAPAATRVSGPALAPGADRLLQTLAALWTRLLDRDGLTEDADFFALGGDSLMAATLMVEIEQQLGQRLALTALAEAPTLGALAARLRESAGARRDDAALIRMNGRGGRPPLVAVGGINGHVLRFVRLARDLGPQQPLLAVQPVGLRWPAPLSIEAMAACHVATLRAACPDGPYRLVGASFGGVVAFEMARQLERAGATVEWLCLLDTRLPFTTDAERVDEALPAATADLPLVRLHRHALRRYRPGGALRAPLHLALCFEYPLRRGDRRDWRAFSRAGLSVYLLPGVHGAIHARPQRPLITRLLAALLAGREPPGRLPADALFQDFQLRAGRLIDPDGCALDLQQQRPERAAVDRISAAGRGLRLRGWVRLPGTRPPPVRLVLFDDDRYLGWTLCCRPRPEVTAAGPEGHTAVGFDLKLRDAPSTAALRLLALPAGAAVALEIDCPARG